MKRFGVIGAALLLLSGCAANDTEPPSNLEGAVSEALQLTLPLLP